MPPFSKPSPAYNYNLANETNAIDDWFTHRKVPVSADGRLLMATWNIANLGTQKRSAKDLELIAHILSRFDLIAVQEVTGNLDDFIKIIGFLDSDYEWMVTDPAGNNERLAYIWWTPRVQARRLFGEVAYPEKDYPKKTVTVSYEKSGKTLVEVYPNLLFQAFDRNPFIGSFASGAIDFVLANVHLYFGAFKDASTPDERAKYARRVMEIVALSKWAKKRQDYAHSYDSDVMVVGDMNIPKSSTGVAAYRALKSSGLIDLAYHSKSGDSPRSNITARPAARIFPESKPTIRSLSRRVHWPIARLISVSSISITGSLRTSGLISARHSHPRKPLPSSIAT